MAIVGDLATGLWSGIGVKQNSMSIFYVVLSTYSVVLSPCGFVLSISGISYNID